MPLEVGTSVALSRGVVRLQRALEGATTGHAAASLALLSRAAAVELAGTGGVVDQLLVIVTSSSAAEAPEKDTGHGENNGTTNTNTNTNDGSSRSRAHA